MSRPLANRPPMANKIAVRVGGTSTEAVAAGAVGESVEALAVEELPVAYVSGRSALALDRGRSVHFRHGPQVISS